MSSLKYTIDDVFRAAKAHDASDVHICATMSPQMRRWGDLMSIPEFAQDVLTQEQARELLNPLIPIRLHTEYEKASQVDFSYLPEGLGRMRCSVFEEHRGMAMVARIVPTEVRTFEDVGLPEACRRLTQYKNGLVLVTGAAGCGKSTTLAALVDLVNRERAEHIITIEDPIEFVHMNKKSQVNQREVGPHTESFARALRASLREDPDVILVGEMRDLETIQMAIRAAETGHLVFSTLHTQSAHQTVDRVINVFPPSQQRQIRTMLAESLRGVITQQLIKQRSGKGRVAVFEVLISSLNIANMIRDEKTYMIPGTMQTGRKQGMQLMDDHLMSLVQKGLVNEKEAYERSRDKEVMKNIIQKSRKRAQAHEKAIEEARGGRQPENGDGRRRMSLEEMRRRQQQQRDRPSQKK